MSNKSKNKRVGICLMVGSICIVVAGLWAVLAIPEMAVAAPPEGKGKGGDKETTIYFDVFLGVEENGNHNNVLLGWDADGDPVFGNPDIFMVCGSGIEGRIQSGGGGTNIDRMLLNGPSPLIDITHVIELTVDTSNPQDADCFGGLWSVDENGYIAGGKGTLRIELPDRTKNEMTVAHSFKAKDTNGKDVYYNIFTVGMLVPLDPDGVPDSGDEFGNEVDWAAAQDAVNDGTAHPDDIPDFFVQVAGGTSWTLSKDYGSQKFACSGIGTFDSGFGILITNARLDRQNNTLLCP